MWLTEATHSQLRVNALNAFLVEINGDRFIAYKFDGEASASAYGREERRQPRPMAGRRSTPSPLDATCSAPVPLTCTTRPQGSATSPRRR